MKLHIYRRDVLERTLDLTGGDLRIGRGIENDIVLEDTDRTVSRFHAELRVEQGELVLIDLNSQNGTWIDGQRVLRATLSPGMTIAMGHFRLVLDDPAERAAAALAAPLSDENESTLMLHASDPAAFEPAAYDGSAFVPAATPGSANNLSADSSAGGAVASQSSDASAGAPSAMASASASAGAGAHARRQTRSKAASLQSTGRVLAAILPRPAMYGAALAMLGLLIGVPYLVQPRSPGATAGDAAAPGQVASTDTSQTGRAGAASAGARPARSAAAAGHPASSAVDATSAQSSSQSQPSSQTPVDPRAAAAARAERAAAAKQKQAAAAIAKQYVQARTALASGQYREAIAVLEALVRDQPGHVDAAALLEQAKAGLRDEAQKIAAQASALASQGDLTGALRELERARQMAPDLAAVTAGIADVRGRMKTAGDEAFRRARQLEAVGRVPDARVQYARAADLLSADDANGKVARERLAALEREP